MAHVTTDDHDTGRFYTFERAMRARYEPADPQPMTLDECRLLAHHAMDILSVVPVPHVVPAVTIEDGLDQATGTCTVHEGRCVIRLPVCRRRPWCVLHEIAHVLAWCCGEPPGHGPMFAQLCIELWHAWGGWPLADLYRLSGRYGVRLECEPSGNRPPELVWPTIQ